MAGRGERAGREWLYGRRVVRAALAPGARRRAVRLVATAAGLEAVREALPPGLPVSLAQGRDLERLVASGEHQGVALEVAPYPYAATEAVLDGDLVVALDQVSDPRNLGAVARSALAAGAAGLVVPRDRAAAVTPAAVKASAGALEHLPVARVTNLARFLAAARGRGFWVYGADAGGAVPYTALDLRGPVVLVFGAEGHGLRRLVREACDALAHVPMRGPVESLNVSVAAALFLFEARRQRGWGGDPGGGPAAGPPTAGGGGKGGAA